jgi:hypothetical protein
MNNQISMITIVAIFAAMGLVGAVVVQSIVIPQLAFADTQGCQPGGNAFKNSDKNCKSPP